MANVQLFDILTFDFDKLAAPIPVIAAAYPVDVASPAIDQPQARTIVASRGPGVFLYAIAAQCTFGAINDQIAVRFSLDGGVNWDEFVVEAKDAAEVRPIEYLFPKTLTSAAPQDFVAQARSINGIIAVSFMDCWIQRVG